MYPDPDILCFQACPQEVFSDVQNKIEEVVLTASLETTNAPTGILYILVPVVLNDCIL